MEVIDLYNKNKEKLDKTFIRGESKLNDDEYYLLTQGWIINKNNEILITRRNLNKSFGGLWECTSGHVITNESSLDGIKREVLEEIGINLNNKTIKYITMITKNQALIDIYIIKKDIKLEDLKLNREVIDAKYVSIDEFNNMIKNKEIIEGLSYFPSIYKKEVV